MSTHENQTEKTESRPESVKTGPELASREADHHMPSLVNDRAKLIEHLKGGGRSGISHDFGKPTFVDSAAQKMSDKHSMPAQAGDAQGVPTPEAGAQNPDISPSTYKTSEPLSPQEHEQLADALASGDNNISGQTSEKRTILEGRVAVTEGQPGDGKSAFSRIQGFDKSSGEVQIGKDHYHVENGKLYREHKNILGHVSQDKEPCGQLEANGKIKFADGERADLNKQDSLACVTDANGEKHNILSAGGKQMDLDEMQKDADMDEEIAQSKRKEYMDHRPLTKDFANALSKQMGGQTLDDTVNQTTDDVEKEKHHFDGLKRKLLEGKVKGEDLGEMAHKLEITSKGVRELQSDQTEAIEAASEAHKIARDFVYDSAETVATAGMGGAMTAAFKSSEVVTSLRAAKQALEAEEGAHQLSTEAKLAINVGRGVTKGVVDAERHGNESRSAGDAAGTFVTDIAQETIPGPLAERLKESLVGPALEKAVHDAQKYKSISGSALRSIAREEGEKNVAAVSRVGVAVEKTTEKTADKVLEKAGKPEEGKESEPSAPSENSPGKEAAGAQSSQSELPHPSAGTTDSAQSQSVESPPPPPAPEKESKEQPQNPAASSTDAQIEEGN